MSTASRVSVTAAIQTYLQNAGITYLSNVYAYPAKFTPEGDFFDGEDPGTQSGALIFMRLANQHDVRMSLQGLPAGGKMTYYDLELTIIFRSMKPLSQDAGLDNDTFLDSLLEAIRASKTAGTTDGTVWQWGEGSTRGGSDLELEVFYPRPLASSNGVTQTNSRLKIAVLQYASA
jgi:hypothetical protein